MRETYNVVVLRQQLGIQEEVSRCGKLVGHSIEEHLRAVVLVLFACALLALNGHQAELQHVDAVAQEHSLTTYTR